MAFKLTEKEFVKLKRKLNYHYRSFNGKDFSRDPIKFPHGFKYEYDIEVSAFVSALFAYGNINQINNSLEKIHEILGNSPYDFVLNLNFERNLFAGIKHRFYSPEDIFSLFKILNIVYSNYGSLKKLFLLYYFPAAENLKDSIEFFSNNLKSIAIRQGLNSDGIRFMFPSPSGKSACKRINLFLRWMVRKDKLDFGLWKELKTSQLIIPVDTHIARIALMLGLTERKNISWKMAEEITGNLKLFNRSDPVKYDFALCHIGAWKLKF